MDIVSLTSVFAQTYAQVFPIDLMRYVIGAGGVYLFVNLIFAGRLALRKIRKEAPPKGQMLAEILLSLRTVVIFALVGSLTVLGAKHGVLRVYENLADYGWLYFAASIAALIVLHDAWFYWSHRILHHRRLFRYLHTTHHRSRNPTPFTSYSFDIGETVVNALFLPVVLSFLPTHPLALLIFLVHMILRNAIGHSGYELFPAKADGTPLFDWMSTVTHHDLHHENARFNMGLYFTWWDRWLRTEHPHYHQRFAAAIRHSGQQEMQGSTGAKVHGGTNEKA